MTQKLPESKRVKGFLIYITPVQHRKAMRMAKKKGISMSELFRQAVFGEQ